MRRDLWRLATPLLALGVSFVVVLIIGAASAGGSPKPEPATSPTTGRSADLTVMAAAQPTGQGQPSHPAKPYHPSRSHSPIHRSQGSRRGRTPSVSSPTTSVSPITRVLPGGSTVTVLDAVTLRLVVTNHLNSQNSYTTRLPVHSYLVCLRPRGGWESASANTFSFRGWICVAKQIGPRPATVTFSLVPPASAQGAGR
jgi:hypothetical protein